MILLRGNGLKDYIHTIIKKEQISELVLVERLFNFANNILIMSYKLPAFD